MRPMTPAALAEYQRKTAAAAVEANRRADAAALAARNKERETAGLPALAPAQFKAERDALYKGSLESDKRLGETYAAIERTRRAKAMR